MTENQGQAREKVQKIREYLNKIELELAECRAILRGEKVE